MLRSIRLLLIALLLSAPACRHDDGLGRVEVRGKVTHLGAPVERGIITFRPSNGLKGPAAGTGIVNGKFIVPIKKGPAVGPHDVEVQIVGVDNGSVSSHEPAPMSHGGGQLKSFSQRVEVTSGINDFEFSFPSQQASLENSHQ